MGKTPNYDQSGKLKNKVITAKYSGERELVDILDDNNYKKIGGCEISCVGCYDTKTKTEDKARMDEINAEIKAKLKSSQKPKTAYQLLEEQNELLREQLESKSGSDNDEELEMARAKYLELYDKKPHHAMKLETILEKIKEKS